MKEFGLFAKALLHNWISIVGGALISVLFLLLNWEGITSLPNWLYTLCLGGGFLGACFQAWLEEHRKNDKENHKELFVAALSEMMSLSGRARRLVPRTRDEVKEQVVKFNNDLVNIIKTLKPMGNAEMSLIALTEPKKIVRGKPTQGYVSADAQFIHEEMEHLVANIEGKIDVVRARLERL